MMRKVDRILESLCRAKEQTGHYMYGVKSEIGANYVSASVIDIVCFDGEDVETLVACFVFKSEGGKCTWAEISYYNSELISSDVVRRWQSALQEDIDL